MLDCTYSVLSRSRIKKRQTKQKSKTKPKKKRSCEIFLRVSQIFTGQYIKTGFHKSQGTEIRRTDWSTPILIQLMKAQPENNRGCPWHPLKNSPKKTKKLVKKRETSSHNNVGQEKPKKSTQKDSPKKKLVQGDDFKTSKKGKKFWRNFS